jgi:AcrR family transcriptional regulator
MFCGGPDAREKKREARREAILQAALELFLEKGYESTTLSDVVGRSGGSLATLYELFENKSGLLRALVDRKCGTLVQRIDAAVSAHQAPREALREIAESMFDKIVCPESTALFKAALAQPDLGPQLYQAGPATSQARIAEFLALKAKDGVFEFDDAFVAAGMFHQMMFGQFHQKLIFGLTVELSAEEKEAHIDRVLTGFFKMYAVASPGGAGEPLKAGKPATGEGRG